MVSSLAINVLWHETCRGSKQGSLWKSIFGFQNPEGMAGLARLDYAPMTCFLTTAYARRRHLTNSLDKFR